MASSTAETGLPKVAAIPAAAPAASSVLRSSAVIVSNCPTSDPRAPPVAMMGPSAPNGPPVPMAIAAESGFRKVTRGGNAAAPEQHLLHGLGNAVAADGFRPVARHDADDHASDDRHDDHPGAQVVVGRRTEPERETPIERKVGDKADQAGERLRHQAGARRDHNRNQADEYDSAIDERRLHRSAGRRQRGGQPGINRNSGGGGGLGEIACSPDFGEWRIVRVRQASLSYHDVNHGAPHGGSLPPASYTASVAAPKAMKGTLPSPLELSIQCCSRGFAAVIWNTLPLSKLMMLDLGPFEEGFRSSSGSPIL